ncbi:serine hydrolase domain-containing protein [Ferruginibacter yonginensis]|uniref:Serine hydrolase domain-containing protein n=1 Tax=Ferruginibacter yonginensis TaxID=1310416 RepID=A0ABV8QV07_9BACT
MSVKTIKICRYCSTVLVFMLFFHLGYAQYNFKKTTQWLQSNAPTMGGRGAMVIFKDGKIIYEYAVNKLSRKQKFVSKVVAKKTGKDVDELTQNIEVDTKIPFASCSKWLSAALIMTFIDDGSLKLSDTVGTFLPQLTAAQKGNITIEQCLSHTTGINPGTLKESIKEIRATSTMNEVIAAIATLPMETAPGESFHYSNAGLQIAAAVIEKMSGTDFKTLFYQRIAKPCDMVQTDYGETPVPLAAGGVNSTAIDYIHFLAMILNNGSYNGKQVLSKNAVALMQRNYSAGKIIKGSPAEAGNWGYGFGEWIMDGTTGNNRSNEVSSPGLFGTFPWVNNKLGYAAIMVTFNLNNTNRHEKYSTLKQIVNDALKENK